jgi:hypothetical protein
MPLPGNNCAKGLSKITLFKENNPQSVLDYDESESGFLHSTCEMFGKNETYIA